MCNPDTEKTLNNKIINTEKLYIEFRNEIQDSNKKFKTEALNIKLIKKIKSSCKINIINKSALIPITLI